ncbi:MAG: efflux RND transporter permease subunit, partial [Longimicrobiales bacterium]
MFISDFAIRRPIITVVVMVALVAFGLFALIQLEVDEYPDIQSPIVTVMILYPGASPEEVEREVIDPVEEAIAGIDGVDRIESASADGVGQVLTMFLFTKGVQEASQDVRDALSEIRGDLPPEIEEPVISRFDPADLPIVSLTLSSPVMTQAQLTALVDPDILRDLRAIPGVASADMIGGAERELTIELRPADLQAAGVSVDDVVNAVSAQNLAVPVGRVDGATDERTIRLAGRLATPDQFDQLAITERGGRTIRLGQVATARDGTEEPRSAALYNDRQAIGINILKTKGTSTTTVADEVKKRVEEISATLPEAARLNIVQDAGERVEASVRNVQHMLIEGAFLTIVVVLVFLNSWRSTVITGLALPISVLSSFIAVWLFGFTLNTMSLLGISLAIGVLIDDAIVVRENIVRHIQMGKGHYQAAHDGTDEIGLAVIATTTTIIAVFVPIALISGEAGQWFKPLAATTASAVLVSLFVSFSLDPMLSAYWPDPQLEQRGHYRGWNPVTRALDWFDRWFDRLAERYRGVIAWALDHRITIVAVAIGSLVGALALQALLGGFGFVPISDRGELNISIETPPGSNLDYTRAKAETIARIVRAHDEVEYTYITVGEGTGFSVGAVDRANIYVSLTPRHERELSQYQFAGTLRNEIRTVGGATAYVYSSGFGGAEKELQFDLTGPDANTLTRIAEAVADTVRTVPIAVDVGISTRGQKPEL